MDNLGRWYEKKLLERLMQGNICIVCKRTSHVLKYLSQSELDYLGIKFDHPFITDNLELLEWKSKLKEDNNVQEV